MEIKPLTGIRAFAALFIMIGHFLVSRKVAIFGHTVDPGNITILGMPLFFVLSGFVIHLRYGQAFRDDNRFVAVRDFSAARIARLYPLFLFFCAVNVFTSDLLSMPHHVRLLLFYFSGVYSWIPAWFDGKLLLESFFGVSWSVSTELFFYLCYPLFGGAVRRISNPKTVAMAGAAFAVGAFLMMWTVFATADQWQAWAQRLLPAYRSVDQGFGNSFFRWFCYVFPPMRLPEFISGVLAAQLYLAIRDRQPRREWNGSLLSVCSIVVAAVLFIAALYGFSPERTPNRAIDFLLFMHMNYLFAVPFAMLIFSTALYRGPVAEFLSHRYMVFLGEISYSLYLSHLLIDRLFTPGAGIIGVLLVLGLKVALTIAMSTGTYITIEVPARRAVRRMIETLTNRYIGIRTYCMIALIFPLVMVLVGLRLLSFR